MQARADRDRLLAILAADGVGYSRLMSLDDRGTLGALDAARDVFRRRVEKRGGRVIDMAGDSVLAVFETATGAANAALDIQAELADLMQATPPDRQLLFRIGVHLGDVIEKDDGSVYGDGVNIAARLQSLARPGGILVSQSVHGVVHGRVAATLDDIGEQAVKNIPQPVRAYALQASSISTSEAPGQSAAAAIRAQRRRRRLLSAAAGGAAALLIGAAALWFGWRPAGGAGHGALADASRLSIVVLPFANLTGDAGQDYFADGLTAALTADLSRIQGVLVIDSATAQSVKGKAQTAQQIGRAFGVRFVLQGSVQRSGSRIRINALLADATTNKQLWSDSFEGDTANLFALQDQVTGRIANTMDRELVVVAARESAKRGDTPQIADLLLRARALQDKPHSLEKWQGVEQLYRQVLAIENDNLEAMAGLATSLAFKTNHMRDPALREKAWSEALNLANKVIATDPAAPEPYRVLAFRGFEVNDLEAARRAAEVFLRLRPRASDSHNVMGSVYSRLGEADKAVEMYTQAVDLSPKDAPPSVFLANLARAHFMRGDYQAAIDWDLRALQAEPDFLGAHVTLAMAYAMIGDDARARAEVQQVRRLRPGFKVDIENLGSASDPPALRAYFKDKAIPAYRKAGLAD